MDSYSTQMYAATARNWIPSSDFFLAGVSALPIILNISVTVITLSESAESVEASKSRR